VTRQKTDMIAVITGWEVRLLVKTEENWTGTVDQMRSNYFFSKKKIKRLG
jgi:hypothetical protein